MPASRSRSCAPRRSTTARWSPTTPRSSSCSRDGGRAAGAVVEADGRRIEVRARAVVNATGVWSDDVRALDEGTHPDSIRPAKGIHITVPWTKVRNDIAVVVPVPKDKRSVFVVPWLPTDDGGFELTYIGTTDTDYDGPIDDPQCTADDVAYLLKAINLVGARAAHRGRRARHLGRPASAGEGGLERSHRRPVAPAQGHPLRVGRRHRHRRQAHDLPGDGRGHRRRGGRAPRRAPPLGAPVPHRPPPPPRRPARSTPKATGHRPPPRRSLRQRSRAACRRWSTPIPRSASRSWPASPTCGPRPCTPPATRWPPPSTTCSPAAPAPGCRPATRRPRRRRVVAGLLAAELGWSAEETDRQVAAYVALVDAERAAPGLPATVDGPAVVP